MKVVIIEDEFFVADHLERLMIQLGHKVEAIFHSGEDFLESTNWEFNVAIVDIQLSEEINGIEVATHIKKRKTPFIFLTANSDELTLTEVAKLRPNAYLTKPFNVNDVSVALAVIELQKMHPILVKTRYGLREINVHDILFIKSDNVYIEIFLENEVLVDRKLLKDVLDELPPKFERVHRSFVVNSELVSARKSSSITIGAHTIPISRKYRS